MQELPLQANGALSPATVGRPAAMCSGLSVAGASGLWAAGAAACQW